MATSQVSDVIQQLRRTVLLRDAAGLSDGQLLEDYLSRRDEAALEALVGRHAPTVWGVCRRLLGHHDAEDAFQATFLVLVRKASSIASREQLANWLYGVARQTALKARATAARRKEREKQVAEMPEPAAAERDLGDDWLDHELSRLPDKYRVVIVLCDLGGKTRKEAARQLGLPGGTVASRLARARAMLAKRFSQRGVALSGGALAAVPSACVSPSLVSSTTKAAGQFAAGHAVAIPVKVVALTEGVLKTMLLSTLKKAAVALLVVLVLMAGAGAVISRTSAGEQPDKEQNVTAAEKAVKDAEKALDEAKKALSEAKEKAAPSTPDNRETKARTRWEYKALSHDEIKALEFNKRGTDTAEGGLNMLGDEGWELVAIDPPAHYPTGRLADTPALYVFKRQKK
jgi:RNA polymerase sigma factor (sigma-70 family)